MSVAGHRPPRFNTHTHTHIHEILGGLHDRTAGNTLTRFAAAYAARLDGDEDGPRRRTFRAFHRARISAAVARGMAFELRRGARIIHARARARVAAAGG